MTTINGTVLDFNNVGEFVSGKIAFTPSVAFAMAGDTTLLRTTKVVDIATNGTFQVDLTSPYEPGINPRGFTYHVELVGFQRLNGTSSAFKTEFDIDVPYQSTTININRIIVGTPSGGLFAAMSYDDRIRTLEILAGISPGSTSDATVQGLLNNPSSLTGVAIRNIVKTQSDTSVSTIVDSKVSAAITASEASTKARDAVTFKKGTVMSTSPLAVRLDGDAANTTVTTLVPDLRVNHRVTVALQNTTLAAVIGIDAGFPVDWSVLGPQLRAGAGEQLNIPTHVTPSGGQATHPSVVRFDEPWNGYRYWMAFTPYPGGSDAHEDPNIVASNDGITWVVPAGLTNPLDDQPGSPKYNSDTDLVFAQGKLYCFWRYRDTGAGAASENLFMRTSADGITWTAKELVYQSDMANRALVSPSFIYDGVKWTMYAVDIAPATKTVVRLQTSGASPLSGQWSNPTACTFPAVDGSEPWHLQVRQLDGTLVALLNTCLTGTSGTGGNLYIRTSADGVNFKGSAYRFMSQRGNFHTSLYRACMVPELIGGVRYLRVWYSAWVPGPPSVWNIYHTLAGVGGQPTGSFAEANGSVAAQTVPANASVSVDINLPPGRFTQPPHIIIGLSDGVREMNVAASNVFPGVFRATFGNNGAVSRAAGARWYAVQAYPSQSEW